MRNEGETICGPGAERLQYNHTLIKAEYKAQITFSGGGVDVKVPVTYTIVGVPEMRCLEGSAATPSICSDQTLDFGHISVGFPTNKVH